MAGVGSVVHAGETLYFDIYNKLRRNPSFFVDWRDSMLVTVKRGLLAPVSAHSMADYVTLISKQFAPND